MTHVIADLVEEAIQDEDGRLDPAFTIRSRYTSHGNGPPYPVEHVVAYDFDEEELVVVQHAGGAPHDVGVAFLYEASFGEPYYQSVISRLQSPFKEGRYDVYEVEGADRDEVESALTGTSPVKDLRAIIDPIEQLALENWEAVDEHASEIKNDADALQAVRAQQIQKRVRTVRARPC